MDNRIPMELQICRRWIERQRSQGKIIWLLTLEFNSPSPAEDVDTDTMRYEVERIYDMLVRNAQPGKGDPSEDDLPLLIGFPAHQQPRRFFHILLAESRFYKEGRALDHYIQDFHDDFFGFARNIANMSIRLCINTNEISAGEDFDNFERAVVKTDAILILPEPVSSTATLPTSSTKDRRCNRQLRDGFRRLIDRAHDSGLAKGDVFEYYKSKSERSPFMTIFPECCLQENGFEGDNGDLSVESTLEMRSATLVIPTAGVARTLTGTAQQVLHDLTGVFEEMLMHDWHFRASPEFAAIVQSLSSLLDDSYDLRRISSPLVYSNSQIPDCSVWNNGCADNDDDAVC